MTVECLQDRLYKVKQLDDAINKKLERLSELKLLCQSGGAIRYDKERVQTSASGEQLENAVIKCVDLEAEIDKDTDDFVDYKEEVIADINKLPDKEEREVVYMRYIKYKTVPEIAFMINRCDRTVQRIHKAALQHLAEII